MHAKQHVFSYHNVSCSYYTLGEKTHPSLLLICGFTGTHNDLLPLAHELENNFYVIVPDLPGWGQSESLKETLTIHHYAKFLFAVLSNEHITKIAVAGHCMGTTLAIELATLYPNNVTSLTLIGTPYQDGMWSKKFFLHMADASLHFPNSLRPFFFLWRSRVIALPVSFFVLKFRTFRKILKTTLHNALAQGYQNERVVEENWISFIHFNYSKAKHLLLPIHLIHGKKDMLVPSSQAVKLFAMLDHATIDIISDAGHLPPVETPKQVAKLLQKYVLPTPSKQI